MNATPPLPSLRRGRATALAAICAGYVLVATLYPFALSDDVAASIARGLSRLLRPHGAADFVLNGLLFAPLGALLFLRLGRRRARGAALMRVTAVAASLSLSIELMQLLLPRNASLFDVLSNTLGAVAGALAASGTPRRLIHAGGRVGRRFAGGLVLVLLAWGAVPSALSVLQHRAPFLIWGSGLDLQLGNEGTLDRPWLGGIYRVALYDRALSEEEIQRNHRLGRAPATGSREPPRPIALYTFEEGGGRVIRDLSGSEPPLDLVLSPSSRFRWLEPRGLELLSSSIARTPTPARGLTAALRHAHELTVEVWVSPRDTLQSGPARIVSFSRDTNLRNFTLGQLGPEVELRLRTPISVRGGPPLAHRARWAPSEGGWPSAEGGWPPSEGAKVHVVGTYRDGVERLYVNGAEKAPPLELTREGIVAFGTPRTLPAGLAFAFVYFFPATFALAWLGAARGGGVTRAPLLALAVGTAFLALGETVQVLSFGRPSDVPLLAAGLVVVAAGAAVGTAFGRPAPARAPAGVAASGDSG